MATKSAATVAGYLRSLDPERRRILSAVRKVVNDHLPEGYAEGITYGVIAWSIPLSTFPDTYNGQPLCCAALAANKNYNSLHLMGAAYNSKEKAFLREQFEKHRKKFDMGQGCLRFKTLDDLPLDAIGEVIQRTPAKALIAAHEAAHAKTRRGARKK
ncbi:MAG TPA: DUF1801 domain-containing protein [Vicinamibacterales bacterium]|nr:DUF1801 domain-containing protein [Vicinamibacterales bacterium]